MARYYYRGFRRSRLSAIRTLQRRARARRIAYIRALLYNTPNRYRARRYAGSWYMRYGRNMRFR